MLAEITVAKAVADATTVFGAAMDMVESNVVITAAVFAPMIVIAGLKIFKRLKGVAK